jgi:hypothetical protein
MAKVELKDVCSETQVSLETGRKGASTGLARASVLSTSGSEIGLLRPVSSTFEASVQSLTRVIATDYGDSI